MLEALKYSILGLLIGLLVFLMFNLYSNHEKNIRETQNINTVLETSNVGVLRTSFDENMENGGVGTIDSQSVINEIKSQIANRYSGKDIQVDYGFIDVKGNVLSQDDANKKDAQVVGVQYKVSVLDGDGKSMSSSIERLMLKKTLEN